MSRAHPTELQKDNILKRCAFRRVGSAHHKKVETVWTKLKPTQIILCGCIYFRYYEYGVGIFYENEMAVGTLNGEAGQKEIPMRG